MYPENVSLYLEDIDEIIKLLGEGTIIKVGNVKYPSTKALSKAFKGKVIKGLSIENSNGEYVSLSENGYVNIYTEDKVTKIVLTNYLFSKQQTINSFLERMLSRIHKFLSVLLVVILLLVIFFTTDRELRTQLIEILLPSIVCLQILPLLTIYLPRRNYIYCRTSNENTKFWETEIFKNVISGVIGGIILYLIQFVFSKFGVTLLP